MPSSTYTNSDIDFDADIDSGVDAIAEALNPPAIPDREVIAPVRDARGILLPIFRLWMRDGYTLLTHAHTPGEAMGNAIDDARGMIEPPHDEPRAATGHDRRLLAASGVGCSCLFHRRPLFGAAGLILESL